MVYIVNKSIQMKEVLLYYVQGMIKGQEKSKWTVPKNLVHINM
jgi:hypothetical protein